MQPLKLWRTMECISHRIVEGDRIEVPLLGTRVISATVQKAEEERALFLFDECISIGPMHRAEAPLEGGFEKTDLYTWLNETFRRQFPNEWKLRLLEITLPSVGEFFGHLYKEDGLGWPADTFFEPDEDERFQSMFVAKERMGFYKEYGTIRTWLRNPMKEKYNDGFTPTMFAAVNSAGEISRSFADVPNGIRPEFWLAY